MITYCHLKKKHFFKMELTDSSIYESSLVTGSGQRLVKHVPLAINTYTIIELLLQMGCFYVVCAEML
jgi:hypothetical protein